MKHPISNDTRLLVLSCPNFDEKDMKFIQETRERLDPDAADQIPPHFTHVMPLERSWQRTIESAASEIAPKFEPIEFEIKTLTILDSPETGEQFLVLILKDYEPLLKFHLDIYSLMSLPAPFGHEWIPHITLGVSQDREMLIKEAKQLKTSIVGIKGVVDSIELIKWQPGQIEPIAKLALGKNQ